MNPFFPCPPRSLHFHPFFFVDRWLEKGLQGGPRNESLKHYCNIPCRTKVSLELRPSKCGSRTPSGYSPAHWLLFCTFLGGICEEWQPRLDKLMYDNTCLALPVDFYIHQKFSLIVSIFDPI